ncbi:ABC transporter B family member 15 [Citrus sinensis]|uniref:ABC transporter B family member 15 n=1 Tax=Citrus sinensis TaxID=2711 RepID=A0ACB8LIS2_CITSI|nr:ABC transporter B family member 15 [Citrus sinensis]
MGTKGGLFRYADGKDKLLLLFGTVGSIGDGMMTPLTMYILSMVINELGTSDISISIEAVDKLPFILYTVRGEAFLCCNLCWDICFHWYVNYFVTISYYLEGMCWTRTAERQASRIRMECLKSVLRQEVGFFDNQTSSSSTFQVIPNCLAHLTSFIGSILVAFLLSWRLALAALPFSLLFIVPGIVFGKVLKDLGAQGKDAYEAAGGIAEQAISSIRTVYSFVGEHQTLKRFSLALRKNMELGIKQGLTKGLLLGSMGMTYGAWAFQSWVGSVLVTERGENGGLVFVAGICTILGGVGIMSALPNLSFISQATTAATRIFEMIDRVPVINSEDEIGKTLAYLRGEIEFKDVDFSYPTRPDTPVLQRFNVLVEAGKTIGLVGSSGSGKSTVISLLERFYDPVKGNILLDGHKIKKLQLKWLRSQMGLVNQEPILFSTSIKENILIGKPGASMETVVKAAQAANVHDFIMKLNDGYETKVGQFGVQLSGGQKQRIAIARALIRDPKILLLDEATSALDAESERIVQEALDQASQGRTMIIIAHRLSTIRKADLIGVLQSGRVIESGSHDVLMQMNNGEGGAYSKMVQLQQSAMRNEVASGSYNPTKSKSHHSLMSAQTPHTPINEGSSYQNSPIYPLSPTFSISMTGSFQMHSVENQNDKNFHDNSHSPSTLLRLLRMSATEWKRTLLGCLGSAGSGAIYPSYAYCLGSVVSAYFIKDDSKLKSETRLYCLIFLGLAFLTLIANLIQHYNFAIMGEHLVQRVREKMLEKIFTFEIGWFDQDENTSAAICAQLANEAHLVFFSASLAYTLSLLVTWRVAIVMIAVQPLNIGCFYSRSVLMKSMSEKAKKSQSEGSQLASEATTNHRTITAFSSQDRILDLFRETMKGPKKESIKQSWFSGIGLFSSQFLTTASITLTFWYAGRIMNQGLVSPKQLFQAFFLLMSTGKNIADAGSMTSDIAKGSSAIRTIFTILDRKSEIDPEDPKANEDIEEPTKGFIELKNVFFSYPSRPDQMIFKGLTLKIEAGKTVALVGQSGSGKSTIIGLIERFYDPQSGSVMVDERNIKSYNLRKLRSCIALVSQEPTLFAGTIRQNIVYGKEVATEAEIRKAAVLANAHEFISSTEDGYDTYCGERGVQLSGGQKQRIALARAVLKNPMILLLDEATSALDSASENLVQEALEKMMVGRTCVVVAHRLSTIQKADNIVVIKNGKVVEQGTQSSLLSMGNGGAYYSLIKMQASRSPYS